MRTKRPSGSGGLWYSAPYWIAAVTLDTGKRVTRKRWTRELAEQALDEMVTELGPTLGYYYQWPRRFHPGKGPRRTDVRSGMKPRLRFIVLRRDGFRCRYCGATPQQEPLAVDHVLPVADGGTNDLDNLVTACQPCNAGKADLTLSEAERLSIGVGA